MAKAICTTCSKCYIGRTHVFCLCEESPHYGQWALQPGPGCARHAREGEQKPEVAGERVDDCPHYQQQPRPLPGLGEAGRQEDKP